ncbi:phosphotransferase [Hazenella sp. IB182357]|uniref:Phosphotransferase n=1 Tax=Polycladospora coralii TaxID=2771432 RepID=A0A926NAU9_9BACL|nr:phosphotransferase [Polycladospora coralii]MBD1371855.1 phosphotransferase [Polycladospora coralii]MBS7529316.1 phosphotransferase [Polycladospora coralii]
MEKKPWAAEYVVTPIQAQRWIEAQFPQLAPVRVHVVGKGFDNTVFKVNERYIFRFPRRTIAVALMEVENAILPSLSDQLPLPIPVPQFLGRAVADEFPWFFTGYAMIQGYPPQVSTETDWAPNASQLARFLKALHAFPVAKARQLGVPYDEIQRLDIIKQKHTILPYLKRIKESGLYASFQDLNDYIDNVPVLEEQFNPTLIHGDLHIRNFLVDQSNHIAGVIDWGDAHIGHPAIDLSLIYSFLPAEGRSLFFAEYGQVDEYTQTVARFKACYSSIILLVYGFDHRDMPLVKAAQQSLNHILYPSC